MNLVIEDRHGSTWERPGEGSFLEELDVPFLRPISMLGATVDEWRKQPKRKKVAQLVDHQNRGQFAAAQNASTRALTDWEEAVTAVRPTDVTENRLDRLEMLVADIASRIDGLTARNAKKGA